VDTMSTARQQVAAEALPCHVHEIRETKSGARGFVWAVFLLLLAGGLAYYSYTLQTERDAVHNALQSTKSDLLKQRAAGRALDDKLKKLEQAYAAQSAELTDASERLQTAGAELAAAHMRLDELRDERSEINEELIEFKQMTRELQRMIDSGRLRVNFRRGRMVVELPAQVLFPSGSADLTADGKEALTQVAKSLRGFASRHFIVAGHTDAVPVSGKFASNWDLSSARSVTVTQALIKSGMRPEQLVAAGYGEYDPIAKNTTEAGRQQNRRIELILEPRLKPLKASR
jgi:chemotaxis protein MotB